MILTEKFTGWGYSNMTVDFKIIIDYRSYKYDAPKP